MAGTMDTAGAFERVYTIYDWYDGPRSGAADYCGRPHWYRSIAEDTGYWDRDKDTFQLTPLDDGILEGIVEADGLWERWSAAYRAGTAPELAEGEERVLPEDRPRYLQLQAELERALNGYQGPQPMAKGEFLIGEMQVRWLPPDH